jgi:hypothetical protein
MNLPAESNREVHFLPHYEGEEKNIAMINLLKMEQRTAYIKK